MKLDRKTTFTLIGIFIIAGLCVGGYSSVGYEGLDGKITIPDGEYLGKNKASYGGILQLKALEKQYAQTLAKLMADSKNNPAVAPLPPGNMKSIAMAQSMEQKPLCSDPNYPHASPNPDFGICYSDAAMANFNPETKETSDCQFGKDNQPAACNLPPSLIGSKQKSKCSNAPACVVSPELGTMGGTIHESGAKKPLSFDDYTANIEADARKLNSILSQMENIVTGNNFKGMESQYMSDSKKALSEMAQNREELIKWRKKVADMRSQAMKEGANLDNSRMQNTSHYYFYIIWFSLALLMCGVAFQFLKQPIFNVIALGIAFIIIAPYISGMFMSLVDDAEQYTENINIDRMLGP